MIKVNHETNHIWYKKQDHIYLCTFYPFYPFYPIDISTLVLEAQDKVGGRINSRKLSANLSPMKHLYPEISVDFGK